MTKVTKPKFLVCIVCLAALLGVSMMAGCLGQNQAAQDQNTNRQYMSEVNLVMDDLTTALGNFNDAVSRDDVVGMQTQSENALAALDKLAAIEVPEGLTDVANAYQEGSGLLRDALTKYVALYTEISSATDAQPFDWSTYDARLKEIQTSYDEGLAKLQEADQAAAGKEGGTAADAQGDGGSNAASDSGSDAGDAKADADAGSGEGDAEAGANDASADSSNAA